MLINSSQLRKTKDKKKVFLKKDKKRKQKLIRSNSNKLIKNNKYPHKKLVDKFLNIGILKKKELVPSKKNFLLLLAFLTEYGKIIKREEAIGVPLKIYRKIIKLLKKTRELKAIPFTFNFDS